MEERKSQNPIAWIGGTLFGLGALPYLAGALSVLLEEMGEMLE